MKKLIPLLILVSGLYSAERFDYQVRGDFFAGLAGDNDALSRAMKLCEDTLAKDPRHAEAMVWHGSGEIVLAGRLFNKGEIQRGGELWSRGMNEMDEAGNIAPENIGVLAPRGATYLQAAPFVPDADESRTLTKKGIADYEKVRELQKTYFDKLPAHSRGELLYGLASGYARLGENMKAREAFTALAAVGPQSGHAAEAAEYFEKGSFTPKPEACTGCHSAK